MTNCHVHTFTQAHTPAGFLPRPVTWLTRFKIARAALSGAARIFDPDRKKALGRFAQILETSYNKTQGEVLDLVRGFYPQGTRFVVLPMDMTQMNAGPVHSSIAEQHAELARLRDQDPTTAHS